MMDDPPPLVRYLALALALALSLAPITAHAGPGIDGEMLDLKRMNAGAVSARAFYYGHGDGYLGKHHAAWYHGYRNLPPRVNLTFPGLATADASIAFLTRLCIEVTAVPDWAQEEYGDLVGRRAIGLVADRMAGWVYEEMGPAIDCWPALAEELMGVDWKRVGTVSVRYWTCDSPSNRDIKSQREGGDRDV